MTFLFRKDMTPIKKLLYAKAMSGGVSLVEATATGNPLSFTTDVAKPLKSLVLPWTPVQSGTGDPSPTNVRSISGVSSLTVSHSGQDTSNPSTYSVVFPALGKNLCRITASSGSSSGMEWTVNNGIISVSGTPNGYAEINCGTAELPSEGDIVVSGINGITNIVWANCTLLDADGVNVGTVGTAGTSTAFSFNMGNYPTAKTLNIKVKRSNNNVACSGDIKIQVEKGSSATEWEPYTNTVYGGSLDVVSGVLTVEYGMIQLNTADMDNTDNYPGWTNSGIVNFVGTNINKGLISAMVNVGSAIGADTRNGKDTLIMSTSIYNKTQTEWIALEMDIQVCMELATPVTYQLTPTQVNALLGDNVIWSDTNGTNTAIYFKKG